MKRDSSPSSDIPAAVGKPARRALEAAGFNNLRQLELAREADLLKLHGMGPKAMRVLREALEARGASFLDSSARRSPKRISSRTLKADLFADYSQFYLWDQAVAPDAPTDWTDEDVEKRVKAAPHVVVVCPVRNTIVPVELEVVASEPGPGADCWDHIAECSLDLPSGQLELHESTGSSHGVLSVVPGSYRVRAYFGRLDSVSEDGLTGEDHYRVVLWPAPSSPLRVLKQWQGACGA